MKLSLQVFKKGKPIYWIIGAVVLFVLFYWLISRGGSSGASGGSTTVNAGPSDAQVAMQAQLSMAQLSANTSLAATNSNNQAQIAVATLAANTQIAQTQAGADVAKYQANLDAQSQADYYDTQKTIVAQQTAAAIETAGIQANYGVTTAQIAAKSVFDQATIQAQEFSKQLDTNAAMFTQQIQAANFQSLVSQVSNVKPNDRDNMLALLATQNAGGSIAFNDPGHSVFNYSANAPSTQVVQ